MGPLNQHLFLLLTARIAPLCATLALWACDSGEAARMAGQAANRVESTMVSGVQTLKTAGQAVQDRLGLGPPPKEEAKPKARGPHANRTRRLPEAPGASYDAATPGDHAPTNVSSQEVLEPGPPVSSSDENPNGSRSDDDPVLPIEDTTIYSRANPEVIPPRLVRGQVSTPIFLGMVPSVNEIELVISARGQVEELQLLSKPRRLTDIQLLNGAKAWEFEPAKRAGVAVRYRMMVTWDATP